MQDLLRNFEKLGYILDMYQLLKRLFCGVKSFCNKNSFGIALLLFLTLTIWIIYLFLVFFVIN